MSKLSEQYRASVAKITATSAPAGFRGRASSGSDAPSKSKSDSRSEIEKLEDELEQARNEDGGPSPRTRKLSKQLEELKAAKKSAPAKKVAPKKPAAKKPAAKISPQRLAELERQNTNDSSLEEDDIDAVIEAATSSKKLSNESAEELIAYGMSENQVKEIADSIKRGSTDEASLTIRNHIYAKSASDYRRKKGIKGTGNKAKDYALDLASGYLHRTGDIPLEVEEDLEAFSIDPKELAKSYSAKGGGIASVYQSTTKSPAKNAAPAKAPAKPAAKKPAAKKEEDFNGSSDPDRVKARQAIKRKLAAHQKAAQDKGPKNPATIKLRDQLLKMEEDYDREGYERGEKPQYKSPADMKGLVTKWKKEGSIKAPAAKKSAAKKPAAKSNGVRKFLDSKKPVHTYNELVASPESIYELARRIATAVDSKVRLSARKKLAQVYDGMDSDARRRLLIGRLVSTQDLKSMSKYSQNIEKVLNNEGEPKCTRRDVTDNLELYRKYNKLRPDSAKFRKVLEDHGVVPATTEKPNTGKKPGPISKKPANDPATGKRYTKRGVTQMLKQLKEAQEKGRKDSAAYKQREADIKRLAKVLKTLSSMDDVVSSASDKYRITVIAASLGDGGNLTTTASPNTKLTAIAASTREVTQAISKVLKMKIKPGTTPKLIANKYPISEKALKSLGNKLLKDGPFEKQMKELMLKDSDTEYSIYLSYVVDNQYDDEDEDEEDEVMISIDQDGDIHTT